MRLISRSAPESTLRVVQALPRNSLSPASAVRRLRPDPRPDPRPKHWALCRWQASSHPRSVADHASVIGPRAVSLDLPLDLPSHSGPCRSFRTRDGNIRLTPMLMPMTVPMPMLTHKPPTPMLSIILNSSSSNHLSLALPIRLCLPHMHPSWTLPKKALP